MKVEKKEKKTCLKCGMKSNTVEEDGKSTKCIFCSRGYGGSNVREVPARYHADGKALKSL